MSRVAIVTADDLGRSAPINAGILRAHADGIVTSASLMVRWPAAADAVAQAAGHPRLALGLHLDLGEWAFEDGRWRPTYEVVDLDDETAVRDEVGAQLARFRELTGRDPTHVDSHQHVHQGGAAAVAAKAAAAALGVPLRHVDVGYRGDFYGRTAEGAPMTAGITPERLVAVLRELPRGVTEIACHPGTEDCDDPLYGPERAVELAALTDPRVRAAVVEADIDLRPSGAWVLRRDPAPGARTG